jgi:hypothetical protein
MRQEVQEFITRYEQGHLSIQEEQALLVYLMNTDDRIASRYTPRIEALRASGLIVFDTTTKRWSAAQVPARVQAPKKKAGRPRKKKELIAVSAYFDADTLEALDRIVSYTTFSRSAYITFIVKRFLQDRKEL